jgi:glyoxylase-like metal-dependent hydrolase (beta-lactamase superfamily II)
MGIAFERLAENTFVARGSTNIGLSICALDDVPGESMLAEGVPIEAQSKKTASHGRIGPRQSNPSAFLIDSGGDADAGRRILRECERLGVHLAGIINTHSNADHCGGNAFLQARTGCAVCATEIEAAILAHPLLETSFLAGGYPQKALKNKFLMAPVSQATHILRPPCALSLDSEGQIQMRAFSMSQVQVRALPKGAFSGEASPRAEPESQSEPQSECRIVSLPGHYFGMVGVMTPDRVFFVADALAGKPILEKYHIFFFYDLAAELETLAMLETIEADWFVPSHAEPTQDIRPLVELNRRKIEEIADVIVGLCTGGQIARESGGLSLEDIVARVCAHYGISLDDNQHVLVGSTIRSYLSWLSDQGRVEYSFIDGRMMFKGK